MLLIEFYVFVCKMKSKRNSKKRYLCLFFLLYETIYLIKVSKKTPLLYRDLRMSKELVVLSTILSNKEAKFNVITKLIDRLMLYKELLY